MKLLCIIQKYFVLYYFSFLIFVGYFNNSSFTNIFRNHVKNYCWRFLIVIYFRIWKPVTFQFFNLSKPRRMQFVLISFSFTFTYILLSSFVVILTSILFICFQLISNISKSWKKLRGIEEFSNISVILWH